MKATDADSGVNGEIFYSLADDNASILQLIDVDERTGAVRLKTPIDYETHRRLEFTVRARDGGTKQLWDSTQVSVGERNSCVGRSRLLSLRLPHCLVRSVE